MECFLAFLNQQFAVSEHVCCDFEINICYRFFCNFYAALLNSTSAFGTGRYNFDCCQQCQDIHPFCDGNGRSARILNASHLYHGGYKKMKSLPLASVINNELSGYCSSLSDSAIVLNGIEDGWLDLSPFVSYMLDAFERCLIDATLSRNALI